ncbi:undecaprenyl-phosphate glucose phosphotransferase [Salinarimonas ramus]|uniref:Undecaprenyl-phosphate glucose phosphotransferase n=1 Tax=Salinarimonas ramus TaxID=690164 RepID=A0A917Q452_9HYPH|nr:undecaprenyl-phosphate glucose phosphotransferase [Salinarimonas ramus]GGK19036.1 undecaprenyl-phosphate glucose phosphotransferase [Salinarimonas ramus]
MSGLNIRDLMAAAAGAAAESGAGVRAPRLAGTPLAESAATLPVSRSLSPVVLVGVVRALEAFIVVASGLVAHSVYLGGVVSFHYWIALASIGVLALVTFQALGVYSIGAFRAFFRVGTKLALGWTVVFLLALAAVFLLKVGEAFSRVWLVSWFAAGLACLTIARIGIAMVFTAMTRAGRFDRRTAIVGGGPSAESMIKALDAQPDTGVKIVGVFDDRSDERSADVVAGYPKLGRVDDLVDFARRTQLDLVIFTVPISAEERILQMLSKLWVLPIDIRLAAHTSKLRLRPRSYSYIGSVPVLDVFDRPIADWDLVLKWMFDKVVGTLLLVMLSPVLLATAIAVKLDSKGPVFFKQKRYGFNNELIEVFKFRSMYTDMSDATAAKLVTKDDPRVTRVGRIIRKTSIDELPQLFNVVFFGNLSLVGPRPHALHAKAADRLYDQVVDGYFARHKVKPGITGWAQINGWRGETDTQEKIQRRVEHDLYYIEHWSVFFDLQILAMTPVSLLSKNENAY